MKHAYLIMAHKCPEQVQLIIDLLDSPENDFYIHFDTKYKLADFQFKSVYSKVIVFQEVSCYWGHYSQVECEFRLLEKAYNGGAYDYFHLLSGQDLPIRNVTEIYEFFESNNGKEFVLFHNEAIDGTNEISRRAKYYHLLTKQRVSHKTKIMNEVCRLIDRGLLVLQMCVGINRYRKDDFQICHGSTWFSITGGFVKKLLADEPGIRARYKWVNSSDELFLQTELFNSEYMKNCYGKEPHFDNLRFVSWGAERAKSPLIMTKENVISARNGDSLFARKFDINENKESVGYLLDQLGRKDLIEKYL